MSAYANHRRGATARLQTFTTTRAQATDGADKRTLMAKNLSAGDSKQLDLHREDNKQARTAIDIFLVFECTPCEGSGRVSVETDTPPGLIVQGIKGLDGSSDWCLPCLPIHDKAWFETHPRFCDPIFSRVRYPILADDGKTILPGKSSEIKEISAIDIFEIYISTFISTMSEYFKTGDSKYAINAWKVLRTLSFWQKHNYMKTVQETKNAEDEFKILAQSMEKLQTLIKQRDSSIDSAVAYKTFVNSLTPSQYYWSLYQLMLIDPQAVHKSCLTRMEFFLFGILTQPQLKQFGCSLTGIEDNFLRMVLERSIKFVPRVGEKIKEFIDINLMVEFLHRGAGKGVEGVLRHWTRMKEVLNMVCLREYAPREFVLRTSNVQTAVSELKGITSYCLMISPSCHRYLSDEVLAEFVLTASESDKKFTILMTEMLSSKIKPVMLMQALDKNITRVSELQKMMATPSVPENKEIPEAKEAEQVVVKKTIFADLLAQVGGPHGFHSGPNRMDFKKLVIRLARMGTEEAMQDLECLMRDSQTLISVPLGPRRIRSLICTVAPPDSVVFNKFVATNVTQSGLIYNARNKTGDLGRMIRDLTRDLSSASDTVEKLKEHKTDEKFDSSPIDFLEFKLSREMVERVQKILKSNSIPQDCPICMEEGLELVPMHQEARHSVCKACFAHMKECPYCRHAL